MVTFMRERPIPFSAPMVRAILDGRKMQTRRVMKPQPSTGAHWQPIMLSGHGGWVDGHGAPLRCPYGQLGDRLWVRETHARCGSEVRYRADQSDPDDYPGANFQPWHPSIHMPRWASRLTLEVTSVRVERLQDIRAADIIAEGIQIPVTPKGESLIDISTKHGPAYFLKQLEGATTDELLYAHWAALWVQLNGIDSWNANPWVWVVEFRRVEPSHAS